VAYPTAQGTFTQNTANPGSDAVNTSATCALYTRDAVKQYAVIVVKPNNARMADVSAYATGTKRISIKFRSPAVGTVVQAVLQNSVKSNTNIYPNGKFGGDFKATTTATNAWETLSFNFSASPSATPNTGLNEIVLLIASNTFARRKVYLDDWTGPSLVGYVAAAARTVKTETAAFAPAFPNPTSGLTQLPFSLQNAAVVSLAVYDNVGRRVAQVLNDETHLAGTHTAELNASRLATGLYTCRLTVDGVSLTRPLSVE